MAFDDETIDVLIGGYLSKDAAMEDYESVLGCGGYLHGAVVVSKDLEGNLAVEQTDHLVRKGAAGLGAIGFAVGLFAPPLLAATAVGGVIGAGAGKLIHNRTAAKLQEQAGATIPLGGAGLILAYPHSAAGQVEPAVTRAVSRVVGEAEETTSRRSRAPSPTPRPRWRNPRADVPPSLVRSRHRPSTSSQPRSRRRCPTQAQLPRSTNIRAGHRPDIIRDRIRLFVYGRILVRSRDTLSCRPAICHRTINRRPLPAALVLPPPSPPPAPPAAQSSDSDTTPPRRPVRQTRDRHRWHSPSPASERVARCSR